MTTTKRKGAVRRADIPAEVLAELNAGRLETASLAEALAIDFSALLTAIVPSAGEVAARELVPGTGFMKRTQIAGRVLFQQVGLRGYPRLARHPSDTVRGWAAFLIAAAPGLPVEERLKRIERLADDPHFGVRETAWLALRPHLAAELDKSIQLLIPWTAHASANRRRFAVESLRPRGVWCQHLQPFKDQPEAGLPLLEPLRADPAKYVQDSVANWLNDAAKSQPKWVTQLCRRWLKESPSPATARICQRAQRSLPG